MTYSKKVIAEYQTSKLDTILYSIGHIILGIAVIGILILVVVNLLK